MNQAQMLVEIHQMLSMLTKPDEAMTIEDVMKELKVSRKTVSNYEKRKILNRIHPQGHARFRRSEVIAAKTKNN
jgi:DNA-directed RNA polymerase specialized sigma subunit